MARKYKVSRKIYNASRQLSVFEMCRNAQEYFDYLQKLTVTEQAELFAFRAHKERAMQEAWERLDFNPDKIAQMFNDVENWEDFKRQTRCWLRGHNVDTGKMVSLLREEGQQSNEGRRLKAQLEKLLNGTTEKDLFEITD